jgi:hypothetical protein
VRQEEQETQKHKERRGNRRREWKTKKRGRKKERERERERRTFFETAGAAGFTAVFVAGGPFGRTGVAAGLKDEAAEEEGETAGGLLTTAEETEGGVTTETEEGGEGFAVREGGGGLRGGGGEIFGIDGKEGDVTEEEEAGTVFAGVTRDDVVDGVTVEAEEVAGEGRGALGRETAAAAGSGVLGVTATPGGVFGSDTEGEGRAVFGTGDGRVTFGNAGEEGVGAVGRDIF